jgi:CRP-like cAMP-binding protein
MPGTFSKQLKQNTNFLTISGIVVCAATDLLQALNQATPLALSCSDQQLCLAHKSTSNGKIVISINTHNMLLRRLPVNIAESIMKSAEFTHLDLRDTLSEPNIPIRSVVFPESGVISVLLKMEDDSLVEIATVGNEGLLGLPIAMGIAASQELVFCQVTGTAWVLPADTFAELVKKHPELKQLCDRYSVVFFDQVSRNAACSRSHEVSKRCARWLLQTQDRCQQNEFILTQEFLALMLGVSRTSVNIAAGGLSRSNLITYVRGKVKVIDRGGLEKASCACYASMRDFSARVMKN